MRKPPHVKLIEALLLGLVLALLPAPTVPTYEPGEIRARLSESATPEENAAEMQRAVDLAATRPNGGTVVLPRGHFQVGSTVEARGPVKIRGQGAVFTPTMETGAVFEF